MDKIKTPQTARQVFGSLVHRTLKYTHSSTPEGFPTKEAALDFYSQNWKKDIFSQDEERSYFEDGINILSRYWDSLEPGEQKKSIALEYHFVVSIGKHTLGGFIDRIDRTDSGFEIIDYKTDRKIPPQEKIDRDLQLSIYLKAFINEWPSLFEKIGDSAKINLTLNYLRHGLKLSTTRTPADLKRIELEISGIIDQVEAATEKNKLAPGSDQGFDPKISALCDWCDFQKICPLFSHKFKSAIPNTQSGELEMRKVGKKFILLKSKKREIEKEIADLGTKLTAYLEREKIGQFFTDKGNILRQLRESYAYNTQELADNLKNWNKNPFLVMKVDATALNKLASGLSPEQKRELTALRKLKRQNYILTVKTK